MNRFRETLFQQAANNAGVMRGRTIPEQEFLRRQAARTGITKLHNNVYVLDEQWHNADFHARIRGLAHTVQHQAVPKKKVYCLVTAAALWGLDIPFRLQQQNVLYLARPGSSRSAKPLYNFVNIHNPRVVNLDGIDVTSVPQTLRDCANHLPFPDALAIIESALRHNALADHQHELRHHLEDDARFRAIYMQASTTSESVGESIAKATIIELGFEPPLQQIEFEYPQHPTQPHIHRPTENQRQHPTTRYRVDFLWVNDDGYYIVGEFDGVGKYYTGGDDIHHQVSRTVARERDRDSHLYQLGIARIIHFDYRTIMNHAVFKQLLLDAGVPHVR